MLSSLAVVVVAPAQATPLGRGTAAPPSITGPIVYPAVTPLEFNGSLRSLPIAEPGPSLEFPIGYPRLPQPLPPAGGSIKPTAPPAGVGESSRAGTSAPAIDFSNVYPNFNATFDLCCPSDPNGDVGPDHYIQTVNSSFQIFDKQGTSLAGPSRISTIWVAAGDTGDCANNDSGDPTVKYDEAADRWLISQFAIPNGLFTAPSSICIAISQTADPINGGWFVYTFRIPGDRIDYPKFGVWPDAYYMSSQQGYSGGSLDAWAFDRANMLNGTFVTPVRFTVAGPALILLPGDLDGAAPPAGAPAPFARAIDGNLWGGSDRVEVYDFHVDWLNTANSTFTLNASLPTTFDGDLCNATNLFNNCVPQPGTATLLETLSNWSMQPLYYRNFGTHDTLVFSHSVDANGSDRAGVRWYELRRNTPGTGAWTLRQQSTHSPDAVHRWMGSIAVNGAGDMAVGYSVSDATSVFPGIRYAGRLSTDPLNTMPQGEFTMVNGGSSTGGTRWGDYSAMAVDPVDDCTFWYTTEYLSGTGRATRIGAFKFPSCVKTISIGDVSHSEGNAGTTAYTFTVSLSGPTGTVVTVDYNTADGSATTADGDYTGTSGTVTFASGDTSETVTVLVNGDNKFEPNENFFVNLTNAMGANIADGQGEGTIVNDDSQPTISIDDVSDFEGHFGQTPFTFTVSLSNPSYQTITVHYATADGTATVAGNDYLATAGTATFLTNDTSESVTVPVIGDIVIEPDETFFVNLSNPTNATIADAQGLGTILNDDLSPNVDCTINGTNGDDILVGTPGNDVICGGPGNDTISGRGGHDVLLGGPGNDSLFGEDGNDLLLGGSGKGDDAMNGGAGNDNLQGEEGNDTLNGGTGSNALFGGNGEDALTGGNGNDLLNGGNGNDVQVGGAGSDSLIGDNGGDSLDTVDGVSGNDSADGGKGIDSCVSDPGDTVINCP